MSNSESNSEHNPIYGDPFEALIAHFEAHDIQYSCNREERRAWFTMNSGSALQKCSFRFDKTGDVLQILIQYPLMVKEKFRPAAMEFITRANYGLVIGNFEMDYNDGEVRYHVSHLMEDGRLDDETIQRLFGTGMGTADRYFPALMRVLFAGETPSEAVDLAELHKYEGEEQPSENALADKAPGTPPSPKKPRAKRVRKAPPAHSSKPQDEHAVPDAPTQDTPPPTPTAPQVEGQDSRPQLDGEGEGCMAA